MSIPNDDTIESVTVLIYSVAKRSHTLREECRLRVFENRVLGRIFGSKKG
jgi:hypothetical protein